MACGVPVVGFKTGGIPEMVEHDVTGLLVEPKDVNSLVSALRYAITGNRYISFGKESRRKAVAEYTLDRFIDAHITLYEEVVQKRNDQTRRRRRMG